MPSMIATGPATSNPAFTSLIAGTLRSFAQGVSTIRERAWIWCTPIPNPAKGHNNVQIKTRPRLMNENKDEECPISRWLKARSQSRTAYTQNSQKRT